MSTMDPGQRERATKHLNRVVMSFAILTVALFVLSPFAFELSPGRALQVISYVGWGIALALFGLGILLSHRLTGKWGPRLRSMALTGEGVPSPRPLPLEEALSAVTDLLTSWAPFAPRVDLIARPSGLVFVRRRLGSTPLRYLFISSRRRLREEQRATLQDLLASDRWNRFVPWTNIRQVRIPGALEARPVRIPGRIEPQSVGVDPQSGRIGARPFEDSARGQSGQLALAPVPEADTPTTIRSSAGQDRQGRLRPSPIFIPNV